MTHKTFEKLKARYPLLTDGEIRNNSERGRRMVAELRQRAPKAIG